MKGARMRRGQWGQPAFVRSQTRKYSIEAAGQRRRMRLKRMLTAGDMRGKAASGEGGAEGREGGGGGLVAVSGGLLAVHPEETSRFQQCTASPCRLKPGW